MNFGAGGAGIHAKVMEWTNDDALELIEQYRSHTELWNRADPKYKDKLCRFRAWSEIAERFGCSKAEVERKMNVLLTQYRREKHKMLVKLYQGIQPNPSKWYAFKRFDFMEAGGGSAASSAVAAAAAGTAVDAGGGAGAAAGGVGEGGGGGGVVVGGASSGGGVAIGSNGLGSGGHSLNGLAAFESASSLAASSASTSSHHRRMKSKEMKYFGAMGLNLPMLIANTQNLESWNAVGQYSPPIGGDRGHSHSLSHPHSHSHSHAPSHPHSHLRVPLPLPFASTPNDTSFGSAAPRSLFGGSSNSDLTSSSPQKPMDTTDIDEKDEKPDRVPTTPAEAGDGADAPGGGGGGGGVDRGGSKGGDGVGGAAEPGSSPIPNTNTREAHKNRLAAAEARDQDDLDIKQELVDFFHAPHPPVPPDSNRSYSSTDTDHRLGDGHDAVEDFAQDLRVSAAAAAAAAAKGLDFSQFVLPPRSLRRSSESIDEKFSPVNMRKLSSTAASTVAGQMLMHSLRSHESLSEENAPPSSGSRAGVLGGGGGGGSLKSSSQDMAASSSAAAAAAAALYAESLNRDDCDYVGSNVSLKLRSMDRTQRIIAEKLISEVLFYGQFNELERSARIQPK